MMPLHHDKLILPSLEEAATIPTMELFFGIFAHEIRTQLSGIVQFLQSILEGQDTDFYLQTINAISHSALDILDNLLTTVKIQAGKLDIKSEKETFCFDSLIKPLIQSFEATAIIHNKSICLTHSPLLDDITIATDKVKLGQILYNLLTNALKFGHPNTNIGINYQVDGNGITIQVTNQGSGIPADKIAILFMPYQQLEGGYAGTGLGLYLSQLYAQALGGKIMVQSESEALTVFTVNIPDCIILKK